MFCPISFSLSFAIDRYRTASGSDRLIPFFISEFDKRPVATAPGSVTNDKLKLIGHFAGRPLILFVRELQLKLKEFIS